MSYNTHQLTLHRRYPQPFFYCDSFHIAKIADKAKMVHPDSTPTSSTSTASTPRGIGQILLRDVALPESIIIYLTAPYRPWKGCAD